MVSPRNDGPTIALVVDSFFRDLGQSAARDASNDTPQDEHAGAVLAPTSTKHGVSAASRADKSERAIKPGSAQPRTGGGTGIILGGGYESIPSSAAPAFGVFSDFSGRWRVDFRATLPISRMSEAYSPATAYLYPIPVRLSLMYQTEGHDGLSAFIAPRSCSASSTAGRAVPRANTRVGANPSVRAYTPARPIGCYRGSRWRPAFHSTVF